LISWAYFMALWILRDTSLYRKAEDLRLGAAAAARLEVYTQRAQVPKVLPHPSVRFLLITPKPPPVVMVMWLAQIFAGYVRVLRIGCRPWRVTKTTSTGAEVKRGAHVAGHPVFAMEFRFLPFYSERLSLRFVIV